MLYILRVTEKRPEIYPVVSDHRLAENPSDSARHLPGDALAGTGPSVVEETESKPL